MMAWESTVAPAMVSTPIVCWETISSASSLNWSSLMNMFSLPSPRAMLTSCLSLIVKITV